MKEALIDIVIYAFTIYYYALLARFVLGFFHNGVKEHPISQLLTRVTDPVALPLEHKFPSVPVGRFALNLALLFLLLFYSLLLDILRALLTMLFI